jgi:hypothetical protein
MNRSAGHFFRMVQDLLWESLMMHIARLTDKPKVFGRTNLTLHNLPELIPDAALKNKIESLCREATDRTQFARIGATAISRIVILTWHSARQRHHYRPLRSNR